MELVCWVLGKWKRVDEVMERLKEVDVVGIERGGWSVDWGFGDV